jgi:hypothetical protein
VIELDAPSVLLQWATGGLLFGWVTARHRLVGPGYGWLLRACYGTLAALGFAIGLRFDWVPARDVPALMVAVLALAVTVHSWRHRRLGSASRPVAVARATPTMAVVADSGTVASQAPPAQPTGGRYRAPEVATGEDDGPHGDGGAKAEDSPQGDGQHQRPDDGPVGIDPRLDLLAPAVGVVGLVVAGVNAGDPMWLSVARMVVGAGFLGAVTDAMLLGHWYLVQPGMSRAPLEELVRWTGVLWLPEVVLLLVPTGMVSVWTGAIDDGYAGMLGWFWGACVVTTIGLVFVTLAALRERQYSAVMAATGLLYLAILTGFGVDLVARATLG